jgi:hypothetical protein
MAEYCRIQVTPASDLGWGTKTRAVWLGILERTHRYGRARQAQEDGRLDIYPIGGAKTAKVRITQALELEQPVQASRHITSLFNSRP